MKDAPSGIDADVLVIGGGASAVWAAWSAASKGASVVLVDKGYCGTSGATAVSGNHVWSVPPVPELRARAREPRDKASQPLVDTAWMERVVDQTWVNLQQIGHWGYPFPEENGEQVRSSLQGPQYMRLMRVIVKRAGVQILDHSPALDLLLAADGSAAGARGVHLRDDTAWTVRAPAVVIATGGCAWRTKVTGTTNNTGDGALMAVEAGAELSGMEFSNQYGVAAEHSAHTKGFVWIWGSFYADDGTPLGGRGPGWQRGLASHLIAGRKVYAQIDKADTDEVRAQLRIAAPNFFLPHDRRDVDPFRQRFPVSLRLEGTVRGTGGIRLVDNGCSTAVSGLFAAGDAATREYVSGASSGGGSRNAAWAMSSGRWAGTSAAAHAQDAGPGANTRRAIGAGTVGLEGTAGAASYDDAIAAVQDEVIPFEKNLFRCADGLRSSLDALDRLWQSLGGARSGASARERQRVREVSAMVANARWAYSSALDRAESRGMHYRTDAPAPNAAGSHRTLSGGLDQVWIKHESTVPA